MQAARMNSIVAELALESCCDVVQLIHEHRLAAYSLLTRICAVLEKKEKIFARNTSTISRVATLQLCHVSCS